MSEENRATGLAPRAACIFKVLKRGKTQSLYLIRNKEKENSTGDGRESLNRLIIICELIGNFTRVYKIYFKLYIHAKKTSTGGREKGKAKKFFLKTFVVIISTKK